MANSDMNGKTAQIMMIMLVVIFLSACRETTIPETPTSDLVITDTSMPNLVSTRMNETNFSIPDPPGPPAKSATPQPTLTATKILTISLTPIIPKETIQVLETITPLLPICEPGGDWDLSPNGQWIADSGCWDDSDFYSYMKVLNITDAREWRINYDWTLYGYLEGVLWPEQWTNNGRFLFVGVSGQFDGGGFEFFNATALLRLNLSTGEITEILPNGFHTFALSNEGDKLAYVSEEGVDILDFKNWTTNRVDLNMDYCRIGDLLWSPTENEIMAQVWTCAEEDFFKFTSYNLIILNLSNGTWEQLLSSTDRLPMSLVWEEKNPIYFEKDYSDQDQVICWQLNIETGELQLLACP